MQLFKQKKLSWQFLCDQFTFSLFRRPSTCYLLKMSGGYDTNVYSSMRQPRISCTAPDKYFKLSHLVATEAWKPVLRPVIIILNIYIIE